MNLLEIPQRPDHAQTFLPDKSPGYHRAGQGLPGSCILDINQFGSFAGFFLNCCASERGSDKKCHRIWRKTSPEVPDAT